MSHVTSKKVTRFFAYGKGYASRKLAYRALAKSEIASEVWARSYELDKHDNGEFAESNTDGMYWYRLAMKEKYPHVQEGGGCAFRTVGGVLRKCWRNHPTLIWCHAAYLADLRARMERMRKEDEEGEK